MATFSARPTLSTMKATVLKTIQGLVSKTLYRAIELLFQPCCDVTITNVVAKGNTKGNYDITITLDKPVHMLKNGLITAFFGNGSFVISTGISPYDESTTIVLNDVNLGSSSGGTYNVSVLFTLPISNAEPPTVVEELSPGAFIVSASLKNWVFPPCVT